MYVGELYKPEYVVQRLAGIRWPSHHASVCVFGDTVKCVEHCQVVGVDFDHCCEEPGKCQDEEH